MEHLGFVVVGIAATRVADGPCPDMAAWTAQPSKLMEGN